MKTDTEIPDGFQPRPFQSGFDEVLGTVYGKETDGQLILGFRTQPHHMNINGTLHGGAIATFADWQVASAQHQSGKAFSPTPTISLSIEYLAPSKPNSWVEMHVKLHKETGSMYFTAAEIYCNGELIARSSGIYRKFKKKSAAE